MSEVAAPITSTPSGAADIGAPDPTITPRRMSEMGMAGTQQAVGMQRLDGGPQQPLAEVKSFQQLQREAAPAGDQQEMQQINLEGDEQGQQSAGPTDVELAQKWRDFEENPNIDIDAHGDKVLWYDADGKGDMRPIRVKDVHNNILMYNDYQRKTTEIAEIKRTYEQRINGQKMLAQDINHEDPNIGLRAWRAMMPEKQIEKLALAYYAERAALEKLDPALQQKFLAQQKLEDENFYYRRRLERMEQAQQQQAQQQQAQQGAAAPDIQFVQQHIVNTLPSVFQQMGISEAEHTSDAFQYELDRQFTLAAAGERDASGQWTVAPIIRRGQAPSRSVIANIVTAAKQNVDKLMASTYAKRVAPPRQAAPQTTFSGSGPAAKEGQRGNISAPKQLRWSDMGGSRPLNGRYTQG